MKVCQGSEDERRILEKILMEAKNLMDAGVSKEVVEEFLASKSKP